MIIEPHYPSIDIIKEISKKFNFTYVSEDWELINGDRDQIEDYLQYFDKVKKDDEKIAIFAIIITALDQFDDEKIIDKFLNNILDKIKSDLVLYLDKIIYWALIGNGNNEEHIFKVTNQMRDLLNLLVPSSTFKVNSFDDLDILIDDTQFLELIGFCSENIDKQKLFNYLITPSTYECEGLEILKDNYLNIEKQKEFVHLLFYDNNSKQHYYSFKRDEFEYEILKK